MAWVRFIADHDWTPRYGVTIAYKDGMTLNVPSACATLAIAAGKAVRLRKVSKDAEPTYVHVETRDSVEDGWVKTERVGDPVFLKEAPNDSG